MSGYGQTTGDYPPWYPGYFPYTLPTYTYNNTFPTNGVTLEDLVKAMNRLAEALEKQNASPR